MYFVSLPTKHLSYKVMLSSPLLSIVIPVFNEEDNIKLLIASIEKELSEYSYELIFIDDFSSDASCRNHKIRGKSTYQSDCL